jgi:hypothetical protein
MRTLRDVPLPAARELKRRYDEDGWVIFLIVWPLVALLCLLMQAWGGIAIALFGLVGQLLVYRRVHQWPFASSERDAHYDRPEHERPADVRLARHGAGRSRMMKALMMIAAMAGVATLGAALFVDSLLLPVGAALCVAATWFAALRLRNEARR